MTNAPGRQKQPRRGTHASLCGTSVVLPPSYLQPRESAWRTAGARQLCHRPETSRGWLPSSAHFLVSRLPRVSLALFRPTWAPATLVTGGGGAGTALGVPLRWVLYPFHLHRLSNQTARNEVEGLPEHHALGLGHLAEADARVPKAPLHPREGGTLTDKPAEQRLTVPSDKTQGTQHLGVPGNHRQQARPPAGTRDTPGGRCWI